MSNSTLDGWLDSFSAEQILTKTFPQIRTLPADPLPADLRTQEAKLKSSFRQKDVKKESLTHIKRRRNSEGGTKGMCLNEAAVLVHIFISDFDQREGSEGAQ